MKGLPLALLACVLVSGAGVAQNNPTRAEQQKETAEASSPEVAESMKLSAEVVRLHKAGKYDEALTLAKRALQLREQALAPAHPLVLDALSNVAALYAARRDYGTARDYYQRVLAAYEQSPPKDRSAVARVLDDAAYLSYLNLDFDKAEKFFQRSLALREETTGALSLETARSAFNLAEFYRLQGEYSKAEPLYQKSIEVRGSALGVENQEVRKALERYSCLYYANNQGKKWRDVISQFGFLRGKESAVPDVGEIMNGKAVSLPKPEYPSEAKARRVSGTVVVKVVVDENGVVVSAEDMCAAHPLLVGTSVRAALKARFQPPIIEGKPARVSGPIVYRFIGR